MVMWDDLEEPGVLVIRQGFGSCVICGAQTLGYWYCGLHLPHGAGCQCQARCA